MLSHFERWAAALSKSGKTVFDFAVVDEGGGMGL
jgi:hypothetical protein